MDYYTAFCVLVYVLLSFSSSTPFPFELMLYWEERGQRRFAQPSRPRLRDLPVHLSTVDRDEGGKAEGWDMEDDLMQSTTVAMPPGRSNPNQMKLQAALPPRRGKRRGWGEQAQTYAAARGTRAKGGQAFKDIIQTIPADSLTGCDRT